MKNLYVTIIAAVLLNATALFASPPAAPSSRVDVVFDKPENFTDVKDSYMGSDKGRDGYLALIKEYLQDRAPRYLSDGQKLSITFTDIDLAGDFEPWHNPQYSDVRIVKEIYPPRMRFSYKLVDASGAVVKEGEEKLIDMAFQMQGGLFNSNDSLRYEKGMLDNWMRDTFPKPKKTKAETKK